MLFREKTNLLHLVTIRNINITEMRLKTWTFFCWKPVEWYENIFKIQFSFSASRSNTNVSEMLYVTLFKENLISSFKSCFKFYANIVREKKLK